jgi:hypothetical protein
MGADMLQALMTYEAQRTLFERGIHEGTELKGRIYKQKHELRKLIFWTRGEERGIDEEMN